MTDTLLPESEFDLRPDPRILPMLGEINLVQWRCLAELVDNAVDGFLVAKRLGQPVDNPEVHIAVPMSDVAGAKISVRDNGPGMSAETLEKAMRAGWTGNDPISSLGMFGMGFNIATARLGTITKVWTTRKGDSEWCGLEIDFDRLIRQRSFRTPRLTRPKIDPHEHGTEVSVERLKPEQRQWFCRTANRTKLIRDLGEPYSAMLRPNGVPVSFRLILNGAQIQGRNHCVWGGEGNPSREVATSRYGIVSAYQPVDIRLADRPFCAGCWQWLPSGDENCPSCGAKEFVVIRQRRVYGWLAIQRYLSANDYGIDLLRNGRKIEVANRDLFYWNNDGVPEEEYPIDDPRHRGRIVGEIHLDHCRVTYMKDRFDRNDPAWDDMARIIRGDGPLRPDKAEQAGFGQNTSPLFLLFQAFRRSSPKPKVAGCYSKLLIVPDNDLAEDIARRFHAGEPEYQTDAKWWELVQEADAQLLTPAPISDGDESGGIEGFGNESGGQTQPVPPQGGTNGPGAPPPQPPECSPLPAAPLRVAMPSLSREYRDDLTNQRWDVKAWQVSKNDPGLGGEDKPWSFKATSAGTFELLVNTDHQVFRSATMMPLDGLLAQLAWSAIDFVRGGVATITFATVLSSLRERYAVASKLDPVVLSGEAALTLTSVARSVTKNVTAEDSIALYNELSPAECEAILGRMASRSVGNPQQAISEGRFLDFAPRKTLLQFFERHPELFFDGRYWDAAYATIDYGSPAATEEAQRQVRQYYASLLTDAIWLAEQDPVDLSDASRARLLRAALALELLTTIANAENE